MRGAASCSGNPPLISAVFKLPSKPINSRLIAVDCPPQAIWASSSGLAIWLGSIITPFSIVSFQICPLAPFAPYPPIQNSNVLGLAGCGSSSAYRDSKKTFEIPTTCSIEYVFGSSLLSSPSRDRVKRRSFATVLIEAGPKWPMPAVMPEIGKSLCKLNTLIPCCQTFATYDWPVGPAPMSDVPLSAARAMQEVG